MAGTILVIEDDFDVREALTAVLTEEGFAVHAAAGGADGLALLREGLAADLILLDLRMPGMNGWQFRAEQQRDPALSRIPVILLTADTSSGPPLETEGRLAKPIRLQALVDEIARVLGAAKPG
jgi:CheY-like chemotaxis protein